MKHQNERHFRIGGVPEHFNLPWHLAIESGAFDREGLKVEWKDYKGGTGALNRALRERKVDIAIVLTEGIIADIHKGNPSSIVQLFITSPLIWGIHVGAESRFTAPDQLEGGRYSISRYGSGSHLISFVDAMQRGWDVNAQNFEVVGGLDGAITALTDGSADCLLWEKFTTKPYVDAGVLRRIGEVCTPWPCFVMAVHKDHLVKDAEYISRLCRIIQNTCAEFMQQDKATSLVSARYGLLQEDADKWFSSTSWATNFDIPKDMLENTASTLQLLGLINTTLDAKAMTADPAVLF